MLSKADSTETDLFEWAYLLLHRSFCQQCPGLWGEELPDVGIHCITTQVPKLQEAYTHRSFEGIYVCQLTWLAFALIEARQSDRPQRAMMEIVPESVRSGFRYSIEITSQGRGIDPLISIARIHV